jgi:hypothetical protein
MLLLMTAAVKAVCRAILDAVISGGDLTKIK